MSIIHIILLAFVCAVYFYWRLPKGNPIKEWINDHSIGIGNGLLIFWVLFFMSKSPRLALFFGAPMLLIGGFLYLAKKNRLKSNDNFEDGKFKDGTKDVNDLGDPRDRK